MKTQTPQVYRISSCMRSVFRQFQHPPLYVNGWSTLSDTRDEGQPCGTRCVVELRPLLASPNQPNTTALIHTRDIVSSPTSSRVGRTTTWMKVFFTMAPALDTSRPGLFVAIRTLAANALAQCVSFWHAIKKALVWTGRLPPRLGRYISVAFHAVVDWISMIIWMIAKFILIFAGICVGLLVLAFILKVAYRQWRRSMESAREAHHYRAESPRQNRRWHLSSTSNWVWYGSAGSVHTEQPVSGEAFRGQNRWNPATERDTGHPGQHEESQRRRADAQPRASHSNSDHAARDEAVRKQQAERKAEQAAQEQRRNEEQEQRRANTHRKLSRDECERVYQRWKGSCDAAFESQRLFIPEPPSWDSHVENCKPVGSLRACTCDISLLLSAGSGPKNEFSRRQRTEMIRWHPDKLHFTRRGDGSPAWTEELHKAVKNAEVCKDW
jgi:hypothetical protein